MERDLPNSVRLDKWLWAARFYKTRALAVEAIEGGKVEVNDDKAKRAKAIRVGDRVRIRLGPYERSSSMRRRQKGSSSASATPPSSRRRIRRSGRTRGGRARRIGGISSGIGGIRSRGGACPAL